MEHARVAIEVLARLSLRFKPNRAAETLKKGLELYGNRLYYSDVQFREPIRHLLSFSWEALPQEARPNWRLTSCQPR